MTPALSRCFEEKGRECQALKSGQFVALNPPPGVRAPPGPLERGESRTLGSLGSPFCPLVSSSFPSPSPRLAGLWGNYPCLIVILGPQPPCFFFLPRKDLRRVSALVTRTVFSVWLTTVLTTTFLSFHFMKGTNATPQKGTNITPRLRVTGRFTQNERSPRLLPTTPGFANVQEHWHQPALPLFRRSPSQRVPMGVRETMSPLNLAWTRSRVTGAGRGAQAGASWVSPAISDIWHQCEWASLKNCFCHCTCLLPFLCCGQSPQLLTAVHSLKAQKKASPWGPFLSMPRYPSGCLSINGAFWDAPPALTQPACSSISCLLLVPWSLMSEPQAALLFYFFNCLVWNRVSPFMKYLRRFLH